MVCKNAYKMPGVVHFLLLTKRTCFITLVALNLDINLLNSTRKHETNELYAEVALCKDIFLVWRKLTTLIVQSED